MGNGSQADIKRLFGPFEVNWLFIVPRLNSALFPFSRLLIEIVYRIKVRPSNSGIYAAQQRLDQREDLRVTSKASWQMRQHEHESTQGETSDQKPLKKTQLVQIVKIK